MKKALLYSTIYEWIGQNNIPYTQEGLKTIFDRSQDLYTFLKTHQDFPGLIPDNMRFQDFYNQMQEGIKLATDPQYAMFRNMTM